jgi:hypothetical protein
MQTLFLNPLRTFYLNIIVWLLSQPGIGYSSSKFPVRHFDVNYHCPGTVMQPGLTQMKW